MQPEKNSEPEKKKETFQDKAKELINKAEEYIDETAEKIHKSETYKKIDNSAEKATKSIFRQAGKWWGKSEQYIKKQSDKKDPK